jgi:hypothetical protein
MRKIVTLFILFSSIIAFGQSKTESENWIVEKHSEYKNSYNPNMDLWFENGYMYYYWTVDDKREPAKRIASIFRIKIKDIKSIKTTIKKLDDVSISKFVLYCAKGKLESKSLPENSNFVDTGEDFLDIDLNENFKKDGINIRMEKAFLHLIKLYGGTATVKKEAF